VVDVEPGVSGVRVADGAIRFAADADAAASLSFALADAGVGIVALVPQAATLEELFFRLTEGDGAAAAGDRAALLEGRA
jgi:non-ribosomal peptide synthetase component E (peptide arylation enzyme)